MRHNAQGDCPTPSASSRHRMTLTPEQVAAISANQQRTNADAITRGARENPPQLEWPRAPTNGSNATDKPQQRNTPRHEPHIRSAAEVAAALPHTAWLLRPYLERDALAVLFGDYGTFKSFIAIDWALRASLGLSALGYSWPAERTPVVLISAEGRALPLRLRAWCIRNCPSEPFMDVLERALLFCIERPINLSDRASALELIAWVEALSIVPGLVIIDTLTRNSDGSVEESTATANSYLAIIDQCLRARYQCAVLMTHHVGHGAKDRMRGPIVLAANTDTLIRVERPDATERLAMLTVERMKDCEPPPPQGLRGCIVELGEEDADGQPMTSLALEASGAVSAPIATASAQPRGKAQRKLLAELRAQDDPGRIWTSADLREVGRKASLHKNTARDAAEALTLSPYMTSTVGGWRLADV